MNSGAMCVQKAGKIVCADRKQFLKWNDCITEICKDIAYIIILSEKNIGTQSTLQCLFYKWIWPICQYSSNIIAKDHQQYKGSSNCCTIWYLCQFFIIVLAFIDNFYGYDVIVWPHWRRKCCTKVHSFPLVSFCLPWWVTWLVVILLDSDWSIKVTWPN